MSRPPFWRVPRNKSDDDYKHTGRFCPVSGVIAGSPSEGELRRGDTIVKIGDANAKTLSHSDAHSLIKNAGNTISMVVQRGDQFGASKRAPTVGSPSVFQPKPPVAGGVPTPFNPSANQQPFASSTLPRSKPSAPSFSSAPHPAHTFPQRTSGQSQLPVTVFPPPNPLLAQPPSPFPPRGIIDEENYEEEMERMAITHQPYRTTPLVVPGAKVKKDLPTASYLQHHPNPMMRTLPVHYDTNIETIMKQKVAGTVLERVVGPAAANSQVVHKQFNSPIGLYSEHNIAETITNQTGVTPAHRPGPKDTVYFDPMKSETFRALQDEEGQFHEAPALQQKVFTPAKPQQGPIRKSFAPPPSTEDPTNTMGIPQEKIQQSYSFRRLMNNVLGETDF